jgi:small-conductance mechanosensitive channel
LLLSRPFQVGDMVLLRSGALSGQLEGTVTEIGITYLKLDTGDRMMSLPNSQVLAAAVSRRTAAASQADPGTTDKGGQAANRPGAPSPGTG